jgi:predicted transcriptional regulator
MYEHTPVAPDRLRTVYQELLERDLETFQGLLSQVSLSLADIGDSIIQSGTDTELVITEPVLYNLPTEGRYTEHVKRGLKAKNHTLLIASGYDIFPVAIAICDDTVLIGPATADQVPSGVPAGIVVSSDEALVEWATQLYDQYRDESAPLSRHILNSLISTISENVSSGVSSFTSKD